MTTFTKATKGTKCLRIAVTGPSDSGKSYTSLLFAAAFAEATGRRTAAIDTENGRLSYKYASQFDFDEIKVKPPFDPLSLVKLIKEAENAGYGQLIADSGSDYYDGKGGLLDMVRISATDNYRGNTEMAWGELNPVQREMLDAILWSSMHIVFTIRSREDSIIVKKNNRKSYEKIGLAPVQRNGFEYKFDLLLDLNMEHTATVQKSFDENMPRGATFPKPGRELARKMLAASPALSYEEARRLTVKVLGEEKRFDQLTVEQLQWLAESGKDPQKATGARVVMSRKGI